MARLSYLSKQPKIYMGSVEKVRLEFEQGWPVLSQSWLTRHWSVVAETFNQLGYLAQFVLKKKAEFGLI